MQTTLPILDRKNLLKLANKIFDAKTGNYVKLCKGSLFDKRTSLSCALGEVYKTFVGGELDIFSNSAIYKLLKIMKMKKDFQIKLKLSSMLWNLTYCNDNTDRYSRRAKKVSEYIKQISEYLQ